MAYWIFKYNPEFYRLDDRLADPNPEITWTVSRYRDQIAPGDTIFIWRRDRERGIRAFLRAEGVPQGMAELGFGPHPHEILRQETRGRLGESTLRPIRYRRIPRTWGWDPDMWEPFVASTAELVPDGRSKIVFDRFHVMKHMTEAVDAVRRWEHRRLQAEGDETLKKTKYLWLYSEENLPESSRERFAALRALHLKTGRAWAIKESLRDMWEYRRRGWALRHWRHWYFGATHSRLKPVIKVARMIRDRLDNVLTYLDHRITTATCEGVNSKIQTIKKTPMASAIGTI